MKATVVKELIRYVNFYRTIEKVYKELERQLKEKNATISPMQAIEIADTIHQITIELPQSGKSVKKTLQLNQEQKNLANLFDFGC